jgi:hypothetical protein
MREVDFAVTAERYESPDSQVLEAVPLALGFAPKKFVREPLGEPSIGSKYTGTITKHLM